MKCGDMHEKPVNNKCERVKNMKDKKSDISRENTVKKIPGSKPDSEVSQGDKVLNLDSRTSCLPWRPTSRA